jgi:hypothetical protein
MFWDGYAVSDNGVSINKVLWDDYKWYLKSDMTERNQSRMTEIYYDSVSSTNIMGYSTE